MGMTAHHQEGKAPECRDAAALSDRAPLNGLLMDGELLSAAALAARVARLGEMITRDYADLQPVLVAVMQGALVFYADLIRQVNLEAQWDTVCLSSYGDAQQPLTEPRLLFGPRTDWRDRDVLFVEDIVDTGKTATQLRLLASEAGARTTRLCTLLDKPARRECEAHPDYVGFSISDHFVVGYGLDFGGRGRNLPCVRILQPDVAASRKPNEAREVYRFYGRGAGS